MDPTEGVGGASEPVGGSGMDSFLARMAVSEADLLRTIEDLPETFARGLTASLSGAETDPIALGTSG